MNYLAKFEDRNSMEQASYRFLAALRNQRMDPQGVAEDSPAIPAAAYGEKFVFTDEQDHTLRAMRLGGAGLVEISKAIGCSVNQASRRVNALGLGNVGGAHRLKAGETWGDGGVVK